MTNISSSPTVIKVQNVSKSFSLPHEKQSSIKGKLLHIAKRRGFETQKVLENISFEVKKGDFIGIVGRNGCGKSTLLKTIAQIYTPDTGDVSIKGRLVPFIELGVGFNPELTGRENVYLNGALLGFSRKEINKLYSDIVEFAELGKFMDQKLKNYSSGMQVRLAFSIAIRAKGDILLLDEVLAVGDEAFQRKCNEFFESVKKKKDTTVILVTHSMESMRRFCDKAILIDKGRILDSGKPNRVAESYSRLNLESSEKSLKNINTKNEKEKKRFGDGKADILEIWTTDKNGKKKDIFMPNEVIKANVKIRTNQDLPETAFGMTFTSQNGMNIFATNTVVKRVKMPIIKKNETVVVSVTVENIFSDGSYTISSSITDADRINIHSRVLDMHRFETGGWELKTGFVNPRNTIEIKK